MKTRTMFALAIALLLALLAATSPAALAGPASEPGPTPPTERPSDDDITTRVPNQAPSWNGHLYCEKGYVSIGFDDPDDALLSLDIQMAVYLDGGVSVVLDDFFLVTTRHFGTTFNFFGLSEEAFDYEDVYGLGIRAVDPDGAISETVFVHYDPTKLFLVCEFAGTSQPGR